MLLLFKGLYSIFLFETYGKFKIFTLFIFVKQLTLIFGGCDDYLYMLQQ